MSSLSSVPRPAEPTVVVVDRFPALSAGLATILADAGFDVQRPARAESWVRRHAADAVFVTVDPATDSPDAMRSLLRGYRDAVMVAVLASADEVNPVPVLRCGAHAVVRWSDSPDEIATVTRSALTGLTVLPTPVVHELARSTPAVADAPWHGVSSDDVRWLRTLARGGSVVQLAREEGYSQREVFRRLASLYRRMGAANRQEAIALAASWGLLAELAG